MQKLIVAAICAAMCSWVMADTDDGIPVQCATDSEPVVESAPAPLNEAPPTDSAKRREMAPLVQSLQPLSGFEGVWNVAESTKAFDGMPEGNAHGRMMVHRALKGHAIIGNLFERADNGQDFMGHMIIMGKEQAPEATSNNGNNYAVLWADSMGHSSYSTNATWANNQFVTEEDTPKGKMRHTFQKMSDDKLNFTMEVMKEGKWEKIIFATYNRASGPQGSNSNFNRNVQDSGVR